jgi:ubiquitin carboxyl-terminal hydrolase 4/11
VQKGAKRLSTIDFMLTVLQVSITFDPFMYLTLPLPVNKKWQHTVHFIPWDSTKEHVKIPVEVNRDASFKDLKQLLGRWMEVNPENVSMYELFRSRSKVLSASWS